MLGPDTLDHYRILGSMLAPALLIAATGSLLISANNRLARVVDRLRSLLGQWEALPAPQRAVLEVQIRRHRARATHVLRACVLLYASLGCFVGTSLALATDALVGFRMGALPTAMAVLGVLFLLAASIAMWREVSLAVKSFDLELDHSMAAPRRPTAPEDPAGG